MSPPTFRLSDYVVWRHVNLGLCRCGRQHGAYTHGCHRVAFLKDEQPPENTVTMPADSSCVPAEMIKGCMFSGSSPRNLFAPHRHGHRWEP